MTSAYPDKGDIPTSARFWGKVAIGERNDCWPWTAGRFRMRSGAQKRIRARDRRKLAGGSECR